MKHFLLQGLLILLVIGEPLAAQPADGEEPTSAAGSDERPPVAIRITDGGTGAVSNRVVLRSSDVTAIPTQTLSFQLEDFRPEQRDQLRYFVVRFSTHSSELSAATVSGAGVLTAAFADYRAFMSASEPQPETAYYSWFFTVHNTTNQLLLTLDLADVPLAPLVESLARALQNNPGQVQALASMRREASTGSATRRLKIRGTNMTLRETFDLIHQQTGCQVFRDQKQVLMTVCE